VIPLEDLSVSIINPTSHFDRPGPTLLASSASQIRRAKQLNALAAVLPMALADRYAEVLTDADVATLKHLAHTRMGMNRLRALAYLEVWCCAAIRHPLP
jgi:hypothetical protein